MKAIYKNIALAALAFSAVACTQEEDFAPSFLNDPDAVRITAQVASGNVTGGFTRSNPLGTTEDEQKAFNSGDAIAVTAGNQDAVTYTFNGTTWTPEAGKYLKWVDNSMTFNAWYPVTQGTDATTFTVPISYADVDAMAAADYMVYSGTQNKTSGNGVTLTMNRKMARIVITPILNDEFPETNYSITDIKVHANTNGYANGTVKTGSIEVTALEQDGVYYALLAPTTSAADATFLTVTVTDGITPQNLTVKGIPATAAGQSYNYTLTVGKAEATIGSVKVNPWTDGTINGGKAEEMVTYEYLPSGAIFNAALCDILDDNSTVTAIEFVAGSNLEDTEVYDENVSTSHVELNYKIVNNTLQLHTRAHKFRFDNDCSGMFSGSGSTRMSEINSIKFNRCIHTSNVTDMSYMFGSCSSLTTIDLSSFDTSKVTNMNGMFSGCTSLTSLDLSSFNTSLVESMINMFASSGLQSITFGERFNTSNVTSMLRMFENCSALTTINFSGFVTSNVESMSSMFSGCSSLTTLDLSAFTAEKMGSMYMMFNECTNLEKLYLQNFVPATKKNNDYRAMFKNVGSGLTSGSKTKIYVATGNPFNEYASYTSFDAEKAEYIEVSQNN